MVVTSVLVLLVVPLIPEAISKWLFVVRAPFYVATSLVYAVLSILVFALVPAYLLWKVLETPIEIHNYYRGLKEAYSTAREILSKLRAR
jgi:hypothetical protein